MFPQRCISKSCNRSSTLLTFFVPKATVVGAFPSDMSVMALPSNFSTSLKGIIRFPLLPPQRQRKYRTNDSRQPGTNFLSSLLYMLMLIITIHFKRNAGFFLVNMILPILMVALLNSMTFLLPMESGERLTYAVLLFLWFVVNFV
jgi:hypothetical protein